MTTAIILCLVLLLSVVTCSVVRQGIAAKWPGFTGKVMSVGILSVTENAESGAQCVMLCLEMQACVSVFYRKVSRRCQFHDVLFLLPYLGDSEVGTDYYSLTTGSCPFGYINARTIGLCYQQQTIVKSRNDAVSDCSSRGEHLIVIDNQEKQDHVQNQVTASLGPNGYSFYIGGSDEATEGQWVYYDGRPLTFFAWAEGFPKSAQDSHDYLVTTKMVGPFLWQDKPGSGTRFYICEKDI